MNSPINVLNPNVTSEMRPIYLSQGERFFSLSPKATSVIFERSLPGETSYEPPKGNFFSLVVDYLNQLLEVIPPTADIPEKITFVNNYNTIEDLDYLKEFLKDAVYEDGALTSDWESIPLEQAFIFDQSYTNRSIFEELPPEPSRVEEEESFYLPYGDQCYLLTVQLEGITLEKVDNCSPIDEPELSILDLIDQYLGGHDFNSIVTRYLGFLFLRALIEGTRLKIPDRIVILKTLTNTNLFRSHIYQLEKVGSVGPVEFQDEDFLNLFED